MNVPKGKPSTSPPVQISQQPIRNIVPVPPRGQTPPIRPDFAVDPQSYSYQAGFTVSTAAHPHEMSKQTVTSGGLPQPGLTPQTSIYSANPRNFYPSQQQPMRQPRPPYMPGQAQMPGQAPMYQQMVYAYPNQAGQIMYQPQNVMYGQRMPQYTTIPNNVQQPFQQYPANQAYASGTQPSYPLYYQQQPQQQTPAMPVGPIAQSRPASVPNQTAPPKRERNPITIVDPTTKKDVTDEILHHKSTPPSSTSTPVSFPVGTSPPQQQKEICAQFASQVAARLRPQPSKHSSNSSDSMASPQVSDSTQGSTTPEPNPLDHSNEMQQNQQHSINMASSDVIKGETSVDPPSFIPDSSVKSNQHPKDPVVFEANEYNVNVSSNMQKVATASKAAVVSANLDNLPDKELPTSKSGPVSIPSQPQKNNIDIKSGSNSAQNLMESKPKSSNEVSESVPKSQKIPATVSVKNSSPPPALTKEKEIKKTKSEGSAEKAEVTPTKSKTSVPTSVPQMAVDKKEEPVKSMPQEPKVQTPVPDEKEVEETKQTPKEEIKESGPSNTEKEKASRDSTSPLDNKTVLEQTPPTKSETNESVIKEEPVAPAVSVSTDNKNETIVPQVEIKIEDVDVSKENAKNNEMTSEALNNSQAPKTAEMQLQYKYKPEQWSPVNPEGKMMYDREFLLQLQFADNSVSKPQGLPNLPDIILDRPVNANKINDMGSSVRDFTPDFFQPLPGGRSGSSHMIRKKNSQSGPRNEPGKKIIKTISISSQDIKLHKAEKAWEPDRKKDKSEMTEDELEEAKTKEIYKQVKSILNKLTPQKFQTLLRQVTELDINTESRLIGVTDLIFEKAVSEPAFSVAYANLCRYLSQLKVPSDSKPGEMVNFRTILLTNCQKEFMKDNDVESDLEERRKKIEEATTEDEKKKLEDDYQFAETSARRRSIGNIRFIGELFKLKMLTVNIMHNCVFKLLKSRDEENLECLCRLLTTIGKELDEAKAKTRVDQYFQQMSKIVSEKKTSSRIRFLLQDVVDLRLRNWVPRREDYNPKTIDQIHKDAAKEIAQKALLLSQPLPPSTPKHDGRRDNRDGRSSGRGGPPNRGSQNARNDDGWTPVSSKSLRNIDLSKMKITKTPVDDNIQLGPGGGSSRFGVWGRGSSGGGLATKSSSQESESPSNNAPANRFTALRPEDEGRPFGRGTSPARSDSRNRGMGGFGRGTLTPRSSQEMDRERAIANVRNIAGGRGSNPASRENSRTRESRQDQKPDAHSKLLSEEEIEKKTKSIIDEYLHINDIKEACLCVSEINHPSNIQLFVELSINSVLERSKIARQQTGNLHHELISKNIITVDAYLKGLKLALEMAEDMEIDIPKIWQYLGELIGPMIQDGCVPLNFLKQACQPLQSSGKSGNLVAEILHDASQRLGHKKIAQLWRNSELTWTDFVEEDKVKQFLIDKGLEFTVATDSAPSTPVDKVSFETIQEQLLVRLRDENCDNEHIFDWIEANIPDEMTKCPRFIRTLMTAVCRSAIDEGVNCKVSDRVIKQRQALLVRYIDNQQEFELQALYALQVLVNELQHPPGVLRSFFEYLYDEDVISETGFTQWSASDDPAEQEGKGVAMKAVVQFFAWLKEGENEES